METYDKNMQKLNKLLSLMDEDTLTKEDFLAQFENVLKMVKKIEEQNIQAIYMMKGTIDKLSEQVKVETKDKTEMSKQEMMDYCTKEMERMMKTHEDKMKAIDAKLEEVKDGEPGQDADEESIIERVKESLLEPVTNKVGESLPALATSVRDALELLQGDERLDVEAIKGLKEMIDEIKAKPLGGGGGFSKIAMESKLIDDETPSGTINGSNTVFTIAHAPNPINSLKVYLNGQRLRITEDYTLSGKTITLLVAPDTGSILLCDYRK